MTLLVILFVALIAIGWILVWVHDNSPKHFWQYDVWSVVGVLSVAIGVLGTILSLGTIF